MSEPEITHDDTETAWRTLAGATSVPSLADLLSPYGEDAGRVMRMQFSTALALGQDPLCAIEYMTTLGIRIEKIEDLLRINDDASEEELHSFEVQEGVVVSMLSDSRWLLFEK